MQINCSPNVKGYRRDGEVADDFAREPPAWLQELPR
jgi:hypothetical protein